MKTLAQKIISDASSTPSAKIGDVVVCAVDLAMIHDSGGPRRVKPILERLGCSVWDKDRVVVVTDHYVPVESDETKAIQELTRAWVANQEMDIQKYQILTQQEARIYPLPLFQFFG